MNHSTDDETVSRLSALMLIVAFAALPLIACAGKQVALQDSESCKRELSDCQFSLENYRAHNRSESEPVECVSKHLNDWRASFGVIGRNLTAMFREYDHRVEVDNGALVLAIPIETIFNFKKATLTEQGKEIALRLNQIAKQLEDRSIVITVRSVDYRSANPGAPAATDRELSFKRAMTFTTKLVKTGVDPTTLGAAGYPGEVDPKSGEGEGWFEFTVLPHPHEMPVFPDDFLSRDHTDAPPDNHQDGW